MTESKNILLTGFMGSGKSTVGRIIAEKLNREFLDTDEKIEEDQNQTISHIFREKGEAHFRLLEKLVINDICRTGNSVIATGGGSLLNEDNLDMSLQTGIVFCLTAEIDILISRMGNRRNRPMVSEKNSDAIIELYDSRKNSYNKLPNQIDTSDISPHETADIIVKLYEKLNNKTGAEK